MTDIDRLRTLADLHGVATSYEGWDKTRRDVAESTLRAVLGALDVDASDDDAADAAIAAHEQAPWRRTLPPSVVTVAGTDRDVPVHVPHGRSVTLSIETESGERRETQQRDVWVDPREIDGALVGRATFALPTDLEPGWHTLIADVDGDEPSTCTLVVTPPVLSTTAALADRQRWGVLAQLYSVRSPRSWGVGDFADLADMASILGEDHGADYVLVNPLHAAAPRPPIEASPYLPTTRRFVNPLYIRVENIRETAMLPRDKYARIRDAARRLHRANTRTDSIDRDKSFRAKLRALEAVFLVPRSPAREAAFAEFRREEGEGLYNFATWCALTEKLSPSDERWRTKAAGPRTPWVERQQVKLAHRIDFYCWLQWICDEQLADAQASAHRAGMDIGVVHDLAVGVAQSGADAWALGSALADGVTVGAPPDDFNQQGQQWNQPPWRPDRLAELGYAPYRDMLRTVLKHAGGLRVDHILGLFRLWWIPTDAATPAEGTYVTYDHEALIGILVLEADRAGAVVVGEDLGVFEPVVQEYLASRGVLGTSILWFERDDDGPIDPAEYRELCLTSVTTHDLPPTGGYLAGEHIDLRARLGLLERDVESEREQDEAQRESVLDLARRHGLLSDDASTAETVAALHRLIQRSPSRLLGVALVDMVGEHRIQNQPGTDETQYENWRIPLADSAGRAVSVEDLRRAPSLIED